MSRQADGAQTLSVALRVPCIDGQRYISTGGAASPLISSALFSLFSGSISLSQLTFQQAELLHTPCPACSARSTMALQALN